MRKPGGIFPFFDIQCVNWGIMGVGCTHSYTLKGFSILFPLMGNQPKKQLLLRSKTYSHSTSTLVIITLNMCIHLAEICN
jgi:hypothetical protein